LTEIKGNCSAASALEFTSFIAEDTVAFELSGRAVFGEAPDVPVQNKRSRFPAMRAAAEFKALVYFTETVF
jgi:hypothetical protein